MNWVKEASFIKWSKKCPSKICPVEKVSVDNMSVENMSVEKMSRCLYRYHKSGIIGLGLLCILKCAEVRFCLIIMCLPFIPLAMLEVFVVV